MWRLLRRLREPWEGRFVTYGQVSRGLLLPWSLRPAGVRQAAAAQRERQADVGGEDGQQPLGEDRAAQSTEQRSRREQDQELLDAVQDKGNLMLDVNLEHLRIGFRTAFDTLINAINTQALADDPMVSPRLGCFLDDWRRAYIMQGVLPVLTVEEREEPEIVRLRIKRGSCDRRNKVFFGLFSPEEVRQHLMEGALGPEYQLASSMHQHGPQRLVATVAFPHSYSWTYTASHHHPSLVRQLTGQAPQEAQLRSNSDGGDCDEGSDTPAAMPSKKPVDKQRNGGQQSRDRDATTPVDDVGGRPGRERQGGLLSWLLAPIGSGSAQDSRQPSTATTAKDSDNGDSEALPSDRERSKGQHKQAQRQEHSRAWTDGGGDGVLPAEASHEHIVHEWEFEADIVGKEVVGWQVRNINSVIYPV